jgi:hypothetical protein
MPSQQIADIIPPKLKYFIEDSRPDSQCILTLINTYKVRDKPSIVKPKTIKSIVDVNINKKIVAKPIKIGNSKLHSTLCISTINPWLNFKINIAENKINNFIAEVYKSMAILSKNNQ